MLTVSSFKICKKTPVPNSWTSEYQNNKLHKQFSWNGFPLDISRGHMMVVEALPGQTVVSVFTSLDEDGIEVQHTILDASGISNSTDWSTHSSC